ncbi:UbiA family prenyltransferase [Aureimonas frigidaquae]|uniref:HAD-superfamily hydrolase subfamily IA variant 1 n=1 Tax=Aureimonas frigidaquae TaxID=424757 RepID=A0A0P0Z1Z1_9HYPH|nr:UbiA family prenyltransferase [Aureimonas frigidaquae]BAT27922.1 HAD-superfamily hydrolase subfamily IA variant 1 [Aureimonas frigidaquae]
MSVANTPSPVLVIDLDGTLCRTDTLHEALLSAVAANPFRLVRLMAWLRAGKAAFKRNVAAQTIIPADSLPYDEDVLAYVRQARAEGRRTVLVSAADHRQVEAVADYLGLFDEAVGTGGVGGREINLRGGAKADYLVARYGERGFDYVGDSRADLEVWARARRAIAVHATSALLRAARSLDIDIEELGSKSAARAKAYVKALRPHQWSKNVLVLLPVLASHQFHTLGAALAALVAFSLTASGVYVLNDLVDLKADRAHPRKRNRPFASGAIPITHGIAMAGLLLVAALGIAFLFAPPAFMAVLGLYFVATCAYSFWLKRKLLVDVVALAGLYTVRILAGSAATGIFLSPWLMAFSMFFFFSLAAIKRQAELVDQLKADRPAVAGRGYFTIDLPVLRSMAVSAGQASVMVLALYISSSDIDALYARPEILWLACPILFYWLSRMAVMTDRGYMNDDPIVFAMHDRISLLSGALVLAVVAAAARGW